MTHDPIMTGRSGVYVSALMHTLAILALRSALARCNGDRFRQTEASLQVLTA